MGGMIDSAGQIQTLHSESPETHLQVREKRLAVPPVGVEGQEVRGVSNLAILIRGYG
jgi:hypothetical protein